MGLLRAIHQLHAARTGLPTPSRPWVRDDTFLQSAAWREGLGRYERFVRERGDGRVLLLELDVGKMTPGIITLSLGNKRMPAPISIGAGMSNQRFIGVFIIRLDVLCPHN